MTDEDRIKTQQTMQELAAQVLRQEQTAPGAQDPDLVRWAKNKLSGNEAEMVPLPPTPVPTPPPAPPTSEPAATTPQTTAPQPATAPANPPTQDDEDEGVLHIQRPGATFQPGSQADGGPASNNSQGNGER